MKTSSCGRSVDFWSERLTSSFLYSTTHHLYWTPLHIASFCSDVQSVNIFSLLGADVKVKFCSSKNASLFWVLLL